MNRRGTERSDAEAIGAKSLVIRGGEPIVVDTGCSPVGAGIERADVPDERFVESFAVLNTWSTPWLERIDAIADGDRRTRDLVGQRPAAHPGQETLEMIQALVAPA